MIVCPPASNLSFQPIEQFESDADMATKVSKMFASVEDLLDYNPPNQQHQHFLMPNGATLWTVSNVKLKFKSYLIQGVSVKFSQDT